MAAAGIKLHPSCRARQEGFGLLFYDCRGPRLLFAATGSIFPADFYANSARAGRIPRRDVRVREEGLAEICHTTPGKGISP